MQSRNHDSSYYANQIFNKKCCHNFLSGDSDSIYLTVARTSCQPNCIIELVLYPRPVDCRQEQHCHPVREVEQQVQVLMVPQECFVIVLL